MALNVNTGVGCGSGQSGCKPISSSCASDIFGCPDGVAPNFIIKRYDNKPALAITVKNCDDNLDFTDEDLVVEFNMWANAKLKTNIDASCNVLAFVDKIGFYQLLIGDILIFERVRSPEYMRVVGFDEDNFLVHVERGYLDTVQSSWKKGTKIKIMKIVDGAAGIVNTYEDILTITGETENTLVKTELVYEWKIMETCTPGCYWGEFKVLKMLESDEVAEEEDVISNISSQEISNCDTSVSITSITGENNTYCSFGEGVKWIRRLPVDSEILIQIIDTPSAEI